MSGNRLEAINKLRAELPAAKIKARDSKAAIVTLNERISSLKQEQATEEQALASLRQKNSPTASELRVELEQAKAQEQSLVAEKAKIQKTKADLVNQKRKMIEARQILLQKLKAGELGVELPDSDDEEQEAKPASFYHQELERVELALTVLRPRLPQLEQSLVLASLVEAQEFVYVSNLEKVSQTLETQCAELSKQQAELQRSKIHVLELQNKILRNELDQLEEPLSLFISEREEKPQDESSDDDQPLLKRPKDSSLSSSSTAAVLSSHLMQGSSIHSEKARLKRKGPSSQIDQFSSINASPMTGFLGQLAEIVNQSTPSLDLGGDIEMRAPFNNLS